jgi:hypothetical protein
VTQAKFLHELAGKLSCWRWKVGDSAADSMERILVDVLGPVLAAGPALCDKLDRVAEDTKGIFVMAHIHGQNYEGANWSKEYDAMRAAWAAACEKLKVGNET